MQEILKELHGYAFAIQSFDKELAQDAPTLHAYLIDLTQYMARANMLMAEYKKKWRNEKAQAYLNLMATQVANDRYFSASQGKDFVDAKCADVAEVYDTAERVSRLCTHAGEFCRTIISSLKSERQFANYGT